MEVFFSSGCDDVVVICHQDNVVDQKVIFLMGFLQSFKEYAYDFALMEPEGPVVGSTDQVVRIDVLDNT